MASGWRVDPPGIRQERRPACRDDDIDPQRMRSMEIGSYKAADGFSIPAYLTLPADQAGPAPMVVLIHGGPLARDRWGWDADEMARR